MGTVTATTEPVRLPPASRLPKPLQAIKFLASKHGMYAALARRYGSSMISVNLPGIGRAVVITDAAVAKQLFNASTDLIERPTGGAGAWATHSAQGRHSASPATNSSRAAR